MYAATIKELVAAFRGYQMGQGIDPDKHKGGFGQDDLKALMEKFPDEVKTEDG